jgi:putative transposase
MRDQKKAEEVAVQRFQLISPLLADGLDAGTSTQLKKQICQTSGFSERTIRRYLSQFRSDGFEGLKPKGKNGQPKPVKSKRVPIPEHIVESGSSSQKRGTYSKCLTDYSNS